MSNLTSPAPSHSKDIDNLTTICKEAGQTRVLVSG